MCKKVKGWVAGSHIVSYNAESRNLSLNFFDTSVYPETTINILITNLPGLPCNYGIQIWPLKLWTRLRDIARARPDEIATQEIRGSA